VPDREVAVAAWESLFRVQVEVMRGLAAAWPTREISLNEYDVMFNLSRQPDRRIRLRDLNQHVLLTQPSVSRLVDRLISRGYLEKEADPADGRGAIIGLTDAGFALFRKVAREHAVSISDRIGDCLSDDELKQLTELCDRLRLGTSSCDGTRVDPPSHRGSP
jgi:DNA-binding MarR family transcriptional regulator